MADDPIIDDMLLERFLAGVASYDERAQVTAWLNADARHAALLDQLKKSFTAPLTPPDTEASWQQLRTRMTASAGTRSLTAVRDMRTPTSLATTTASRWRRSVYKVAAAVILVAGASSLWNVSQNGMQALEAPLGKSASAALPDGTKLTLAPGSRAEWPRRYGKASRDVTLTGEGFFDVIHDSTRPFRVLARGGIAEDVGTRFVVRNWPELERLEVAVEEGIVNLFDSTRVRGTPGTLLHAGETGRLARDGTVEVRQHTGAALAWMQGELVFEDTPVSEALPVLERWYKVTLRADSALVTRRVTARFAKSELPQLLDAFALALNARVVRDGAVITLVPMQP